MSDRLNGLDHYLTTDPRDAENPRWDAPAKYTCGDCGWTGRALGAGAHHRATGHGIRIMGLAVPFACCALGRCVRPSLDEQADGERCGDCGCDSCVCE